MKSCTKCKEIKSLDNFPNRITRKGTPIKHSWCKPCHATYKREIDRNANIKIKKFVFDYLRSSKCVSCGSTDILSLEFDHRNPATKRFNICKAVAGKGKAGFHVTFPELLEEIRQCDVMCRNCHQAKTHKDNNSWRWVFLQELLNA